MPTIKTKSVTISHVWDDLSATDFEIEVSESEDVGTVVDVESGQGTIRLYQDSWPEIRDRIDAMFDSEP